MSDLRPALLPLLYAIREGRVHADAARSKFLAPATPEAPVRRVTAQVDELFAHRPPLARRGPVDDSGGYPVLITGAGRRELMSHDLDGRAE